MPCAFRCLAEVVGGLFFAVTALTPSIFFFFAGAAVAFFVLVIFLGVIRVSFFLAAAAVAALLFVALEAFDCEEADLVVARF